MKQYITQKQWEELDLNQVDKWFSVCKEKSKDYPSIGDMIEFLGDNLIRIEHDDVAKKNDEWMIKVAVFDENGEMGWIIKKELIDALWEACKYKLKN